MHDIWENISLCIDTDPMAAQSTDIRAIQLRSTVCTALGSKEYRLIDVSDKVFSKPYFLVARYYYINVPPLKVGGGEILQGFLLDKNRNTIYVDTLKVLSLPFLIALRSYFQNIRFLTFYFNRKVYSQPRLLTFSRL